MARQFHIDVISAQNRVIVREVDGSNQIAHIQTGLGAWWVESDDGDLSGGSPNSAIKLKTSQITLGEFKFSDVFTCEVDGTDILSTATSLNDIIVAIAPTMFIGGDAQLSALLAPIVNQAVTISSPDNLSSEITVTGAKAIGFQFTISGTTPGDSSEVFFEGNIDGSTWVVASDTTVISDNGSGTCFYSLFAGTLPPFKEIRCAINRTVGTGADLSGHVLALR